MFNVRLHDIASRNGSTLYRQRRRSEETSKVRELRGKTVDAAGDGAGAQFVFEVRKQRFPDAPRRAMACLLRRRGASATIGTAMKRTETSSTFKHRALERSDVTHASWYAYDRVTHGSVRPSEAASLHRRPPPAKAASLPYRTDAIPSQFPAFPFLVAFLSCYVTRVTAHVSKRSETNSARFGASCS